MGGGREQRAEEPALGTAGQRPAADILSWLRVQEAKIGRESFVERDLGDKTSNTDELEAFEDGDRV